MGYILYYSNYCQYSKEVLRKLSQNIDPDLHFICIDSRVVEKGKVYIQMEQGQRIIMPETITKVPSLLLLNDGFKIIDDASQIINYFSPQRQEEIKRATMNNMEPTAFAFNSSSSVVSDNFSFLDQDSHQMEAKGNGGTRQMHNYVSLNDNSSINTPENEEYGSRGAGSSSLTIEQLQEQRNAEIKSIR